MPLQDFKMGTVTQTVYCASIISALAVLGAYWYQRKNKVKIPITWTEIGTVKKLHLYPLKSGHRVEMQSAVCSKHGMRQSPSEEKALQMKDRSFVVYGEKDHEFRTARTYPKMMLIDISVHDENHIALDAPTMRSLYVKIPQYDRKLENSITLHDKELITTLDCGDEAALWLSRYILERDSGLRLGYHNERKKRDIRKTHQKLLDYYKFLSNDSTGLFSDLSSVLLLNQASVNDLNRRIGNSNVTAENFRPNIVVDGPSIDAYAEDDWDWIKIGEVVMRNVKDCTRCMMTTINPDNASRNQNMEPLTTLKTYRMSPGPEKSPVMGINLEVRRTGQVKVGDTVYYGRNED